MREPVSQQELEARAVELSRQTSFEQTARGEEVGMLILRLGRETCGIAAASVSEVVSRPVITPMPLTPGFVAGVMNLRGEMVAVLDLAAMFGLPGSTTRPFAVVTRHEDMTAAFLADEVTDVAWFPADTREALLSTLPAHVSRFFDGVFRSGERLVSVVDLAKVLDHPDLLRLRQAPEPLGQG